MLHDLIRTNYPQLNPSQEEAISNTEGPQLIIAGPGSGKTFVLVLRALNILLQDKCKPKEMILCTFTEKAAFELRDRIWQASRNIGSPMDLSQLNVGTIHSLSNKYISQYKLYSEWGNNPDVLDELTQKLFLYEHFEEMFQPQDDTGKYLGRWSTKWTTIEYITPYLDKITEELIDLEALADTDDAFIAQLAIVYQIYVEKLKENNKLDFAHQQKIFHDLLNHPDLSDAIQEDIKYVMVDEYQDTNYIQERLMLELASPQENICVVGDDDQSLYRFRGATVRNILEFPQHFENCNQVKLETNYRSHKRIIGSYNAYMSSFDWEDHNSNRIFRHPKKIREDSNNEHENYPSVFRVYGANLKDEGERIADLVEFLMTNDVISDYNQVAILLHSVRENHSSHYITALRQKDIPVFAPRARNYFDNPEVKMLVACFAIILNWNENRRGSIQGRTLRNLSAYVDDSFVELVRKNVLRDHPLAVFMRQKMTQIQALTPGQTLDERLADYFYQLIAFQPFKYLMKEENAARNMATFSELLAIFQNYYNYYVITDKNKNIIQLHFFNSFLRFLYDGGVNEYEDPDLPFPSGYVQIMTIHQAKGLEFPVVIVGSLDKNLRSQKQVDRDLQNYYQRPLYEPMDRITGFDRMRLHYVAFSRPQKLLVLTSTEQPNEYFNVIWEDLLQWPYVQKEILAAQRFTPREFIPPKKSFSFSSDIKVYETCPRQYQYFKYFDFTPSRTAEVLFGSLVHQTIEDIHRLILAGHPATQVNEQIEDLFQSNYRYLLLSGLRPLSKERKDYALGQVKRYFTQNLDRITQIIETEVDVSLEKEAYILTGKVDLIMGADQQLEILDFKAQPRPPDGSPWLFSYYDQLLIYAHILQERYQKTPDRLVLYWTAEETRQKAAMTFPYEPQQVEKASHRFDIIAHQILNRDFDIKTYPQLRVCRECDLLAYCQPPGLVAKMDYLEK